MTEKKQDEISQ